MKRWTRQVYCGCMSCVQIGWTETTEIAIAFPIGALLVSRSAYPCHDFAQRYKESP